MSKSKVYELITEDIIKVIETTKTLPWKKGWINIIPKNIKTRNRYRGVNRFLLNYQMVINEYKSPYFGTFKQIQEEGGKIKKGEKGFIVIAYNKIEKEEENKKGEKELKKYSFVKYYKVFNIEQTEGLDIEKFNDVPNSFSAKALDKNISLWQRLQKIPEIKWGGNKASYHFLLDQIKMPNIYQFITEEEYYFTLLHEITHSTGHSSRLNRDGFSKINEFGSYEYSKEELIAEIGACFLCSELNIKAEDSYENSKAYIQGWIKVLKNDSKMLIQAASKAEEVCDYLLAEEVNKII